MRRSEARALRTRRAPGASRGFTLLEVLVALVIVALGMSALLEALTQSASNLSALRDKTVAEWIAMNQIALARLALNAPVTGTTQGDVQNCGNGNWHWQQQVTAVDAIPGLLAITVSVQRTGTASPSASQAHPVTPGATPGMTGSLGANVSLGPTAALGSVSSLNSAGCASFAAPGSALGSSGGPSLGSMPSIGAGSLSTDSLGSADTASIGSNIGTSVANSVTAASAASRSSAGDGAQSSWLVTLTGFRGNSLGAASGESPDWAGAAFATNSNTANGVNPGISNGTLGGATP